MENIFSSLPQPKTEAEYETVLNLLLKEMGRHEEQMNQDRLEIERLKAETQIIGAHTDAVLESIRKQLDLLQKAN